MRRYLGILLATAVTFAPNTTLAGDSDAMLVSFEDLWNKVTGQRLFPNISMSNGRIEAQQVLISAKFAGRLAQVLVNEGEIVDAGAPIARIDTADLDAQLAGARAQIRRSETSEIEAAASIAQRESELTLARQELERALAMSKTGSGTMQQLDLRRSQLHVAEAANRAARASQDEAQAATEAARAEAARIQSLLDDAVLKAPCRGRVEYKLVQTGEVVAAGAPVATLLDLSDVSMMIFLPARAAGRLAIGDEARIILDPAPQYVVPATVSFVASEAQFTPKTVETEDEREKLMFRVKLKIAPDLLKEYETRVKTGVRGIGYVRTDPTASWPANLQVKLPQ
ncbi:HlyD family efflux transporter periplasmic adaptor subunit (plasmid) [Rhizobium sullae]|uniref:Efflux transporter periplasmic adaptor subunit n=1 Tax=Rhizobium sullae TaxID=50338 RepID=A0A2N0DHG5_RHISU|nr:HlyD family efflux transporter periplasmic adaptor subunit [Rhizobium sullae]PKA45523.1 efflux transporter periplasmic adaptor subunit [Rhizobium sullae]UWU18675.1 HlyD family efflux transporter periplasmic adaptor subunit [Rhizobium sullae]